MYGVEGRERKKERKKTSLKTILNNKKEKPYYLSVVYVVNVE